MRRKNFRITFALVLPGMLVAATGVGAGDLATAGLAGSHLGTAVMWAVVVGAFLKFVLTEGLARWQLATGSTLLEGSIRRLGWPVAVIFLPYLLVWSFFVGAALMGACGVTLHAILPVFDDASTGKVIFGAAHGILGLVLVLRGGFALFEKVMAVCIGVMFLTVTTTAVLLWPGTGAVLQGTFVPAAETLQGGGLTWTVAVLGGVGGTLTVLCYGYWIREEGRDGPDAIRTVRIDLAVGYAVTMIFGMAMVVIGSMIELDGRGANLVVDLATKLEEPLGTFGRWVFLVGAFGAVFSSLLGVWQAVPYLFADYLDLLRQKREGRLDPKQITKSRPYRVYLVLLAVVPIVGLFMSFREVQKYYAVIGALFIPMLALVLLLLNGRRSLVGKWRNAWTTTLVLILALALFLMFGYFDVRRRFG